MKTPKRVRREARKLWRLCRANDRLDENCVRQTVQLAVEGGRSGSLAVLSRFLRLVKIDWSRQTAKVETASPLPPDVELQIVSGLARIYGAKLAIEYVSNPALIGGVRITVGSDVYDGTVRRKLQTLASRFSEAGAAAG